MTISATQCNMKDWQHPQDSSPVRHNLLVCLIQVLYSGIFAIKCELNDCNVCLCKGVRCGLGWMGSKPGVLRRSELIPHARFSERVNLSELSEHECLQAAVPHTGVVTPPPWSPLGFWHKLHNRRVNQGGIGCRHRSLC